MIDLEQSDSSCPSLPCFMVVVSDCKSFVLQRKERRISDRRISIDTILIAKENAKEKPIEQENE